MAVPAPMMATMVEVAGVNWNSGAERATMYTPAVTMVAAWIRAETGVGPSMASGSQTYSGICADFPVAPMNSSSAMALNTPKPAVSAANAPLCRAMATSVKRSVPSTDIMSSMPRMKPESPTRFTMNAFLPGVGRRFLVIVETDQQVAAQSHAFPAHEQQRVVVGQHQHQHEEHEQVQVAEEAVVAVIVRHVPDGVDVDQEADAGDHQDHDRAERVEQEAPIRLERAHLAVGQVERQAGDPGELDHLVHLVRQAGKLPDGGHREQEGNQDRPRADQADKELEGRRRVGGIVRAAMARRRPAPRRGRRPHPKRAADPVSCRQAASAPPRTAGIAESARSGL